MAYKQGSMTAIRAHEEPRTILDFSGKCSKNKIRTALRDCRLTSLEEGDGPEGVILYLNEIKVGMYSIVIQLPYDLEGSHKLKEFRDFEICIYDSDDRKASRINVRTDVRFKDQYWVPHNFSGKLRVKHLIDVISHCKRLDRLKAFL